MKKHKEIHEEKICKTLRHVHVVDEADVFRAFSILKELRSPALKLKQNALQSAKDCHIYAYVH